MSCIQSTYFRRKDKHNPISVCTQEMGHLLFGASERKSDIVFLEGCERSSLADEHINSYNTPFKFNDYGVKGFEKTFYEHTARSAELDDETGNYYYGARYYNPKWSMWLSVDPLAEEMPTWSPYNFVLNNPIRLVDPDGRAPEDVIIVFNKSTGKLAIIDNDHYQKGLPTKIVSAKDYVHGGIRNSEGKLTHNQILVMENVFSGGKATNGVVERDPKRPQQKPIPNGTFDLLDNDADTKHTGWFRLDKQDANPYNDKDDATGRDGFRFHLGIESWGCVTCDVSEGDRQEEWNVVTEILNTTSTTTVPEKRGNQKWNPFSWLTSYGTMEVIGEDKIPTKKVEE